MMPGLRADACAARAGNRRALASVMAAPRVAAWCRGSGPRPEPESAAVPRLRLAAQGLAFGRIPGSFAWGDHGAFGLAVCRAVGSDRALVSLVAPLLGRGLFDIERAARRQAIALLPAGVAGEVRTAFEVWRDEGVSHADVGGEAAVLRAAMETPGSLRRRLAAAVGAAVGEVWTDELAALAHGDLVAAGAPALSADATARWMEWRRWEAE